MISIGNNSDLGSNCFVVGEVNIGNDVKMAFDVFITSMNRDFSKTHQTIWADGNRPIAPVTIHDDVFLAARSIVLAGVTIGEHVVESVVSKDVPSWCVLAGNPAQIVKWRKEMDSNYDPNTMTPLSEKLRKQYEECQ